LISTKSAEEIAAITRVTREVIAAMGMGKR
jgi:hypothetical protein